MKARRVVKRLVLTLVLFVVMAAIVGAGAIWLVATPTIRTTLPATPSRADADRLESDVRFLAAVVPPRNGQNVDGLERAAAYIESNFEAVGCRLFVQTFMVDHVEYKNVACSFGPEAAPRVVLGAHYDVHGDDNPGADDNASGVAGILELARILGRTQPDLSHRIDLVAFTLEEPPYFHSEDMGSYAYARHLKESGAEVKLMISVEMIGYFSDEEGSQNYPLDFLSWIYPTKGNFIGVVGSTFDQGLVSRVKNLMTVRLALPVYSINAPALVTGVDFSDHWSFWQHDFPAAMVTDTAFMRNPNYHRPSDTPDTLDYGRMAIVVDGLYRVAVEY